MIDWIYMWGIFTLVILILGFYLKDYLIGSIGATSLLVFGIFGLINGLPDLSDWGNAVFSLFSIFIGLYILLRGTLEQLDK